MRTSIYPAGFVVFLASALFVHAQAPYETTIIAPTVEVRSGPSSTYYVTTKLRQGERVKVMRDAGNGWLAITPPAGSFSWIQSRLVDQRGVSGVVKAASAPIRVGSHEYKGEPTVESTRVSQGTQVVVIGRAEGTWQDPWLPIMPTPTEVRYIPASAIQSATVVQQTQPPPLSVPAKYNEPRIDNPRASNGANVDALLAQAQQAEKENRYRDAEALYEQVKDQVKVTNYPLAVECLNRIQYLRDRERGAVMVAGQSPAPANRTVPGTLVAAPSPYPPVQQVPGNSQYCYQADPGAQVRLVAPVVANASPVGASVVPPSGQVAPSAAQWYEAGRLERTSIYINNKRAYRLVPLSNRVWGVYATADDNVNLDAYANHIVQLYGELSFHGEARNYHINVHQVSLQQ